jgi:hypothetical protein
LWPAADQDDRRREPFVAMLLDVTGLGFSRPRHSRSDQSVASGSISAVIAGVLSSSNHARA